ncbi:MAG: hypothetical protein LBD51_06980 [Bifidobacteriaceae bacterium]|nr:hypothetical protein [Bifidobacteriaceae bacterium]
MRKSTILRAAAIGVGALALSGVAGMAFADDEFGSEGVEVFLEIEPLSVYGDLTMTVAATSAELHEDGSTDEVRRFSGTLPTVTVTDERDPADVPSGLGWYVLGSIEDFTGDDGQPDIPADQFGWAPVMIDDGDLNLVSEGDEVATSLDDPAGPGLVASELLALAVDSGMILDEHEWTASAELILKTAPDVAAGNYAADLTLTLME